MYYQIQPAVIQQGLNKGPFDIFLNWHFIASTGNKNQHNSNLMALNGFILQIFDDYSRHRLTETRQLKIGKKMMFFCAVLVKVCPLYLQIPVLG